MELTHARHTRRAGAQPRADGSSGDAIVGVVALEGAAGGFSGGATCGDGDFEEVDGGSSVDTFLAEVEAGDGGDRRLRAALERELDGRRRRRFGWLRRRFGWLRRRVAIGGFGVPAVVLGLVATAAATTGTLVAVNATSVFQSDRRRA